MKAKTLFVAVTILFLFFSLESFAQPMRDYLMDKLSLSDQQLNEIEKIRNDHLKKMSDFRNELEKLAIDLRTEWKKSNIDRKKIETLTDKISDIRSKMQKQRLNHWFDVYNLLDEKQKEIFRDFRSKFFGDGKFWGPRFKKELKRRFPGFDQGRGLCELGFGPWWDK